MKNDISFQHQVTNPLLLALKQFSEKNAFCINGVFYTYKELGGYISGIRGAVKKTDCDIIGLIANDDIETYAAILALWLEGKSYVPISPDTPKDRNENIIKQAGLSTIIDSSEKKLFEGLTVIRSGQLAKTEIDFSCKTMDDDALVYILFTSGTTGIPKGVPITRANLAGFINALFAMQITIDEHDKCLQMFELTFDLSVMSYLAPLLKGACVYTIPKDTIKYNYIAELMDEQGLTFALMVPSIIHYLRPYFSEINCPAMKYSLFCGEALPLDVTAEWGQCIPNAKIMNVYGPTEDTIFCTHYTYNRSGENKAYNGLLSIGTAMEETYTIVVNDNNEQVAAGEKGQLCLGGVQLTPGYWNNETKNKEAFFYTAYNGQSTRFYKTGDLCYCDTAGDIMYLGRIDSQTKIQGFRVELSEVEFYAKEYLDKVNAVAIALTNKIGNTEIGMVIEADDFDTKELVNYMKTKMPAYMIPTQFRFIKTFPLNSNGKIDRKLLKEKF